MNPETAGQQERGDDMKSDKNDARLAPAQYDLYLAAFKVVFEWAGMDKRQRARTPGNLDYKLDELMVEISKLGKFCPAYLTDIVDSYRKEQSMTEALDAVNNMTEIKVDAN